MKLTLQFLGATNTVTGSKYLLTAGTKRILIDCGLFQGFKLLRLRNWAPLPVDPASIDAVILTHAHIDHCGYLPLLVKNGFAGPVFCSAATEKLCAILLPDSGYLQEEEARYANHKGYSKHHPALPLYTREDAVDALRLLKPVALEQQVHPLSGSLGFTLRSAGHILGACSVTVHAKQCSVAFSGDIGRHADPVMLAPTAITEADYLVVESTYGDRLHPPDDVPATLATIFDRTFNRRGVVIIPAFAVGRAQLLMYYIARLKAEGRIPASVPVYLNSPMAANVTALFAQHSCDHRLTDEQCAQMRAAAQVVTTVEDSEALNRQRGPMIIISASGMATGGRVLHHIAAFGPDPRNTILFVGYQAGGTRGAALVAGAPSVKIHGNQVPIRAEVVNLNNLSAHADFAEILGWLGQFRRAPRTTFVTHGEPAPADAMRVHVTERLGWHCHVPDYCETVTLA